MFSPTFPYNTESCIQLNYDCVQKTIMKALELRSNSSTFSSKEQRFSALKKL